MHYALGLFALLLALYRLRAELAAGGCHWDIAQALRTSTCAGRDSLWWIKALQQSLCGDDQEKIHHKSDEQEINTGGDELAVFNRTPVDVADEIIEVGLTNERAEQRVDDIGRQ